MVHKKEEKIVYTKVNRKKRKRIKNSKKEKPKEKPISKSAKKDFPTLQLKLESEIAMDFATKAYETFNKIIKSVVLFGSSVKQNMTAGSDIDIIIIVDDVAIIWDEELIAWYREELDRLMRKNPYQKDLHINTIKLSTWWEDLMKGDPVVINVLRYGESMIDFGGFFEPLKFLLLNGKIKSTPEAVYNCLQRAPTHFLRSRAAELNAIEGLFWAMVDSSHAALISAGISPASPEHIPADLKEIFVDKKRLNMKYAIWYRDLFMLHKQISHGELTELKGVEIDAWQERTREFMKVMADLVNQNVTQ
ncbi:MAG: nucleotidyltransferase domain-containing protein [Candidatus Nanoarchaeia archaeon]|nr:nucleotidyltransferase domain-containing protein [Candidatus Nanoarchaeia archaeon]MDD5357800.1 nucleotidyltransferase domain-containing protein [Candidatus Nanoarchaeia archaeon]MDD5588719.1 nucleotidyltransferase domain-containing protein [Candidatus Nanoarchaeia archaeon]